MSKIEIGKKAPPFTLEGTGGTWSLEDGKGSAVVIYFYPARQHFRMHPGRAWTLPR